MVISYQGPIFTLREELISISTLSRDCAGLSLVSAPHPALSLAAEFKELHQPESDNLCPMWSHLASLPLWWRPPTLTTVKIKTRPSHVKIIKILQKKCFFIVIFYFFVTRYIQKRVVAFEFSFKEVKRESHLIKMQTVFTLETFLMIKFPPCVGTFRI